MHTFVLDMHSSNTFQRNSIRVVTGFQPHKRGHEQGHTVSVFGSRTKPV